MTGEGGSGMNLGQAAGQPAAPAQQGIKVRVMAVGKAPANIFVGTGGDLPAGSTYRDVLGKAGVDVRGNLEFKNVSGTGRGVRLDEPITEDGTLTVKPAIQGGDVLELVHGGEVVAQVVVVQSLDNGLVVSYVPVAETA